MTSLSEPANTGWLFPFTWQDWELTPPAVQAYLCTVRDEVEQLQGRVETLEARLSQNSTTSHRPPSSDNPYKKLRQRSTSAVPRKAGGKPGHQGHRQALLPPTTAHEVRPERCCWGNTTLTLLKPYHTYQVLELLPIAMQVTHWVLHQGWWLECGRGPQPRCPLRMPRATAPGSVRSWAKWLGPLATAAAWCKPWVRRCCASRSAWGLCRKGWTG